MSDHPVPDDAVTAARKRDTLVRDFPADLGRGIPGHDAWVAIAPAGSVERIAAQARQEEVRERVAEQRAVHEDLALLLRVLGLGDHARPQSSHEVMLDAINEVGRLRARVEFGERTEAQIRAAQQEADARLAEQRRATYPVVTTDAICLEGETRTQVKREPFADLLRQDGGSPC